MGYCPKCGNRSEENMRFCSICGAEMTPGIQNNFPGRTKIGLSVGLLGTVVYFTGIFNGLLATILVAGYILLFEESKWLKANAVKAVLLSLFFSLMVTVVNLIPDMLEIFNGLIIIVGGSTIGANLVRLIQSLVKIINLIEKVMFIMLGIKALHQKTMSVPVVDELIGRYMN